MNAVHRGRTLLPVLAANLGIALYSVMDAVMKGLVQDLGAINTLWWRAMISAALAGALFLILRRAVPERAMLRLHAWRAVVVAGMAFAFFWALARLPMADAIALSFIAPLIALYLASVLLGERISGAAIAASVLGIVGVVVITSGRIGSAAWGDEAPLAVGAVFLSAALYAYNLILARRQAQRAGPLEIAVFQNLVTAAVFTLFAPVWGAVPGAAQWPALVAAAALATVSLGLMSWAYARAEAQVLIPVEYTAFGWAALFGWWVYGEALSLATLIGVVLIVAGCLIATYASLPRRPRVTAVSAPPS